ncbi:MAG: NosD domain-containing protein [Caldilineaceae bacterium]
MLSRDGKTTLPDRRVERHRALVYGLLIGLWFVAMLGGVPGGPSVTPVYAQGGDTYAAPAGSDANTCTTPQSACRTIQAAIGKTAAGGTVHAAPGVYAENIQMRSGVSVVGAGPTSTSIVGSASVSGVVLFDNVTNAALQGFRISVSTPVAGTDRAVVFYGSSDRTAVVRNNIISNTQYGIFVWTPSTPTIENNTLVSAADEQGIYVGNGATAPLIRNNIITGYMIGIHVVAGTAAPVPVILYNDIWNNTENYRSYPDQAGTNGNLAAEPQYVNAGAGDFHLRNMAPVSPGIDAGDPSSPYNREPGPNGGRTNMGAYGNTVEAETTPGATKVINFELPALGADPSRVINPYVDGATGVVFQPDVVAPPGHLVGLVKNNATSACAEPASTNQTLGIGVSGGSVGLASTAVRATFSSLLYPPVTVSVIFQALAGQPLRVRLFDAGGNLVASNTETGWPAMGTCGLPGDVRTKTAVTATSTQPVAYAVMDMDAVTGYIFVLDDFRFLTSAGASTISNVVLSPASPANRMFNERVNLTFNYATGWPQGVRIWTRPLSGGNSTPNYAVNGSPLYPAGSGSGDGFFTVTSGKAIVDGVRIQMWTPDETQLLAETRVAVDYRFSNGCYLLARTHTGSGADPVAGPAKSAYCVSDGQYNAGEAISLNAGPAAGWMVGGWSGTASDGSTAAANSLVMPAANQAVRVDYVPLCYGLTLEHSGIGSDPAATPASSVGCPAGRYHAGETIHVDAAASVGWWIEGWIGTSNDAATTPSNGLTMPAAEHRVIVKYASACYTLALTHNGSGGDPLAAPQQSAACMPGKYVAGDVINLHAAPEAGWHVANWSGTADAAGASTDNALTMPPSNHGVSVTYEPVVGGAAGDTYEEDGSCTEARTINVDGIGQEHSIHAAGDVDWVKFAAAANVPYRVEVSIPSESPADVVLALYERCDGAPAGEFDATFAPGAQLDFTPAAAGPIYVRVNDQNPQAGGANVKYQITVQSLGTETEPANRLLLLVGGGLAQPDRLQSNISHVTDAVYAYFRASGLGVDDITYLTNDPGVTTATGRATLDALHSAITAWAKQRLKVGGAFTLYLMDHGETDTFYLDKASAQALTAQQLDAWLDELEDAIPQVKITVFIEACYSGSFIDGEQSISKDEPNRLVITATSPQLLAYASTTGAYFSDFMLASLEQGHSLLNSFRATYAVVRELSDRRQEPQLDGNGNGIANEPADVVLATRYVSGAGSQGWAPYIVSIQGPPKIEKHGGVLQAVVRDDKKVKRVWAVIKPPSYKPPETSAELVAEMLPTIVLQESGADTFAALYTGFDEAGVYSIAVHAEDEDNLVALPKTMQVGAGGRAYLPVVKR